MTVDRDDEKIRGLLRGLSQNPPDGGFSAQLHLRLAHSGAPKSDSGLAKLRTWTRGHPLFSGGFAGAAAGLSVFALMSVLSGSPRLPPPTRGGVVAPREITAIPNRASCDPTGVTQATAEVFVVPQGKVALLQLNFAVEREVEAAEFSVLLPEGLAFFSEGEQLPERTFRWTAPLGLGDNRMPIAVVGTRPGRHRLAATATIAGEVVVHELVLDVREDA